MTFTDNKLSVSRKQKEPLQLLSALNGAVPVTGKITDTEDKRQRIFAGYNNHPENWNQKKQKTRKQEIRGDMEESSTNIAHMHRWQSK